MDGKPRRRLGSALIASSFAVQAAILAAIIALVLPTGARAPRPAPANGWLTTAPAYMWGSLLSEYMANVGPMYYAALTARGWIEITRSSSGAGSATVAPPPGLTFTMVSATSEAQTFLVAAQGRQLSSVGNAAPVHLYTLQLGTPPQDVTLSPLPVPAIPGNQFWSALLSPDGSEVAVALTAGDSGWGDVRPEVRVYPVTGGTPATWSATAPGQGFNGARQDPALLSWSGDGRLLGVNWRSPAPGLRVLDTQAPGGSLLAASRMIALPDGQPAGASGCDSDATLTADAAMVVCAGHGAPGGQAFPSPAGSQASLLRFDATTGHPLTALVPPPTIGGKPVLDVRLLWVSPSGHGFIVASYTGSTRPAAVTALNEPVRAASSLPLDPYMIESAW
jgi:hypothetical protein